MIYYKVYIYLDFGCFDWKFQPETTFRKKELAFYILLEKLEKYKNQGIMGWSCIISGYDDNRKIIEYCYDPDGQLEYMLRPSSSDDSDTCSLIRYLGDDLPGAGEKWKKGEIISSTQSKGDYVIIQVPGRLTSHNIDSWENVYLVYTIDGNILTHSHFPEANIIPAKDSNKLIRELSQEVISSSQEEQIDLRGFAEKHTLKLQ